MPPPEAAELPLTLKLSSVVVLESLNRPPPPLLAKLPLTELCVSVVVPL